MDFDYIYKCTSAEFQMLNPIKKYHIEDICAFDEICKLCHFEDMINNTAIFSYKDCKIRIKMFPYVLKTVTANLYAFKTILQNNKKFQLLATFNSYNLLQINLLEIIFKLTNKEIDKILEILKLCNKIETDSSSCYIEAVFIYRNNTIKFFIDLYDLEDSFNFYDYIKKGLNNLRFIDKLEEA